MDRKRLIRDYGKLYSEALGIRLKGGKSSEVFRWFLASVLFGAPISEKNAEKTFLLFKKSGVDTPEALTSAGWDRLVKILDSGGYTRYDFKTADKLLEMAKNLAAKYDSDINILYQKSYTDEELEENLMLLAKGIGRITAEIFLRELVGVWKINPQHTPLATATAKRLNIKLGKRFDKRLDAALVRYAHAHKKG